MGQKRQERLRRAQVRTRIMFGPGTPCRTERFAFCHRESKSLPLHECAACPCCAAVPLSDAIEAATASEILCWPDERGDELRDRERRVYLGEAALLTPVWELLGPSFVTIHSDTPTAAVSQTVPRRAGTPMAVVDDYGRLLGTVDEPDFAKPASTVGQAMRPLVHSLPETAPLTYAIQLMADAGLCSVPIVRWDGSPAGVLTANDVIRWISGALGYAVSPPLSAEPGTAPADDEARPIDASELDEIGDLASRLEV